MESDGILKVLKQNICMKIKDRVEITSILAIRRTLLMNISSMCFRLIFMIDAVYNHFRYPFL
ncbi:hypothetical protein M091_4804 [Parabacteroides distasonis str. 3776 D15 i]|uniref:Uncharacterized protein n=1 Tax=Parabacteroides distasonis str. 3776 D15 i TaxID=1339342 RepID=A0AB34LDJ8_PARDI|nr:hypothetical protein M091_4804 [Parabacteroides distasonis str. 3776 D15 i]